MSDAARRLALRNLTELQALYDSMDDDHPAKQRIKDRVQEAKDTALSIDKRS